VTRSRTLRRLAALILGALGLTVAFVGIAGIIYGIAFLGSSCPTCPIDRSSSISIVLGAGIVGLAMLHAVAAAGLWRERAWAGRLAMATGAIGIVFAVVTALGALNTGSSVADPSGRLQPYVDARGLALAVAGAVGYALVVASVLLGQARPITRA
jgi:hypothetical protein